MTNNTMPIENELYRLAIESLEYVVLTDYQGKIVYMCPKYAAHRGLDPQAVIGAAVHEVIPNTRHNIVRRTGQAEVGRLWPISYDPDPDKQCVCNRYPIRSNGEVVGVISTAFLRDMQNIDELYRRIQDLTEKNEIYEQDLIKLRGAKYSIDQIIGNAPGIAAIKRNIEKVAKKKTSVLLTGETGTGKELFANAIHQLSDRSSNTFVKVNCAAIPKDLLESELFGYADGAFSGALKGGKIGKFEAAHKGTILLDEISELPLPLQAKLLRVLQEREVEQIGSLKPKQIDIRLICNSNKNIYDMVRQGTFREDLFHRINVIELQIPPLREHLEDLPELCNHFILKINAQNGIRIQRVSVDVLNLFHQYIWPGNIRELEHVLERACILSDHPVLSLEQFDFLIMRMFNDTLKETIPLSKPESFEQKRAAMEKETILKTLVDAKGNKSHAAKLLDMDRSVLYGKLKKYGL